MFAPFMVNAWVVGTIVALVAGPVGWFVVLRGSAFVAHAIPNGAFAGAAAATLAGVNVLIGLGASSLGGALGIGLLARRGRRDVAVALVLVTLLGVGALLLSLSDEYEPAVYSLLFGEVLGVSSGQIVPTGLLGAGVLTLLAIIGRPLLLASVLPDSSRSTPARVDVAFLALVALTTTVCVPVVGTTLIFSLLIGPAAGARAFSARPLVALGLATVLCVLTVWIAVAASYASNWPVGFWVGTVSAGWYLLGRGWTASGRG